MAFKRNNNVIDNPGNSFATLNPLVQSSATLSGGNLKCAMGSSATKVFGNFLLPNSGKWYWEVMFISGGDNSEAGGGVGIAKITSSTSAHVGNDAESYAYRQNGHKANSGSAEAYHDSYTNLKVIQFLWNGDNKSITFGVDGSMATSEAYAELSGEFYPAFGDNSSGSSATFSVNFGQDPTFTGEKTDSDGHPPKDGSPGLFYYEPPEGAKALCSANLPMTVENPQEHFRAVTWIGNGDIHSIKTGMKPDLIWLKDSGADYHPGIFDSVRGASKVLWSSRANEEATYEQQLKEFNIDGFTLGDNSDSGHLANQSGNTYVAWTWKAGGGGGKYNIDGIPYADFANTGLTTDGVTPIGMSVNTKAGFSIVKYTGGSNVNTIPHGLNSAPEMIIIKNLKNANGWVVGSSYLSSWAKGLGLDIINEEFDSTSTFNSTAPDNSVFTLGNSYGANNGDYDYIAYCWHSVPGYSALGSYDANGSTDGPFIYTGFKPAFVMIKRTDVGNGWEIHDTARDPHNPSGNFLIANEYSYSFGSSSELDFLSNGFKIRTNGNSTNTQDGGSYIYMAFAEHSM